jgi:hypothetical protein
MRHRHVILNMRFFSESMEVVKDSIVDSFASISKLRGYCWTAMSSSFWWFVIFTPAGLSGSVRSTGAAKPQSMRSLLTVFVYPARVAACSPSLLV